MLDRNIVRYHFLYLFIFLSPFVNNINGFMMKFYSFSFVGPLFYAISFLFFGFNILLYRKKEVLLIILGLFFYFLILVLTNRSPFSSFVVYIKLINPIIIYFYVRHMVFDKDKMKKIIQVMILSAVLYSSFIVLSVLTGFTYYEGKGYIGAIHAINALTMYYLVVFFFLSILKRSVSNSELFIFVAYVLIKSKTILIFMPIYIYRLFKYVLKNWSLGFRLLGFFGGIIFSYKYFYEWFILKFQQSFIDLYSMRDLFFYYTLDQVLNFLTFGRWTIWLLVLQNYNKTFLDVIIGSGYYGAKYLTGGKIGIEMDVLNAFNVYGMVGVFLIFLFYYVPIFKFKISNYSKLLFFVVLVSAFFGGHLAVGPIANTMYGVVLGLLYNNDKKLVGEFFEIRNGD
ncbi:hypothetical protein HOC37_01700 [bacterium]|jgi:hypothetical protein|nr:hypothetical protein [bacterium]MBT3581966.1 hypothetical protein [bacterium]MBT4551681.1 hypothetical protein [bacterium]